MPYHKVRTGCTSCKRRKVKCDEAKPTCERCVKAGLSCEYVAPKRKATDDDGPASKRLATTPQNLEPRPPRKILPIAAAPPAQNTPSIQDTPSMTSRSTSTASSSPYTPGDDVDDDDDDDADEIILLDRDDTSSDMSIVSSPLSRSPTPKVFVAQVAGLIDHYLKHVGPTFPVGKQNGFTFSGLWSNMWTKHVIALASGNQLMQDSILMLSASDLFYRTDDISHECQALRYKGRVLSKLQTAIMDDPFSALLSTILLSCSQASLGEEWSPTSSSVAVLKQVVNADWETDKLSLAQLKHMVMTNEDPLVGNQLQYRMWQWYGLNKDNNDDLDFFVCLFYLLERWGDPEAGLHPINRAHLERWLDRNDGKPGMAENVLKKYPLEAARGLARRQRRLRLTSS